VGFCREEESTGSLGKEGEKGDGCQAGRHGKSRSSCFSLLRFPSPLDGFLELTLPTDSCLLQFIEKLDLPALAPVFALVRQQTRCPPYVFPAALENSKSNSPKPYIIAATLSLKPGTLTGDEVKGILYGYVEGERGRALVNGREKEEEVWTESERKRVGAVLESIREKVRLVSDLHKSRGDFNRS
jgi:hypothetical protein